MTTYNKGDLVLLNRSVQNWLSRKFGYVCKVQESTGSVYIVTREREVEDARFTYAVDISQISKPTERQLKHPKNIKELEWQNRP